MLGLLQYSILAVLARANPLIKRWNAAENVGSFTSDVFPPTGSKSWHSL